MTQDISERLAALRAQQQQAAELELGRLLMSAANNRLSDAQLQEAVRLSEAAGQSAEWFAASVDRLRRVPELQRAISTYDRAASFAKKEKLQARFEEVRQKAKADETKVQQEFFHLQQADAAWDAADQELVQLRKEFTAYVKL